MKKTLKYCTRCLMPETRPRVTFDDKGLCNACQWTEEKRNVVDWAARKGQLEEYCNKYRSKTGNFDCIVPVSGGKDSSYVAFMMKDKLGMHPLCINVAPPLEFNVGKENLEIFINAGYDCLRIFPNPKITRIISKKTFIEYGQPLMSWIINVQVAVFKLAIKFNIPFVMFGEDGEVEYGGSTKLKYKAVYDIEDSIKLYLSGINPEQFRSQFSENELYWWLYPREEEFRQADLAIAHWSYFENWDPYEHYLVSKKEVGLKEHSSASVSTYNNFAQTDTCLYDLHTYLMYLKFGFGRCTQDVGIDIRRGAMSRKQGLQLVKLYDGIFPQPYLDLYLDYFEMNLEEFNATIDRNVNKNLFEKIEGKWVPIFEVK